MNIIESMLKCTYVQAPAPPSLHPGHVLFAMTNHRLGHVVCFFVEVAKMPCHEHMPLIKAFTWCLFGVPITPYCSWKPIERRLHIKSLVALAKTQQSCCSTVRVETRQQLARSLASDILTSCWVCLQSAHPQSPASVHLPHHCHCHIPDTHSSPALQTRTDVEERGGKKGGKSGVRSGRAIGTQD